MSKRRDSIKSTAPVNTRRYAPSGIMLATGVIEASGDELWRLLRPTVRATGPLKILRRTSGYGYVGVLIPEVVERWGATRILKRLRIRERPVDLDDAAGEALADLLTPGKRLSPATRTVADRVALDLLDACVGANLTASAVWTIGTKVARMEFGAGSYEGWRLGKRIFVTGNEVGACGLCNNLSDLLAWWIRDWDQVVIKGTGLKPALLRSLGLVRGDDDSWDGDSVRINGRMWRRQSAAGKP